MENCNIVFCEGLNKVFLTLSYFMGKGKYFPERTVYNSVLVGNGVLWYVPVRFITVQYYDYCRVKLVYMYVVCRFKSDRRNCSHWLFIHFFFL